MKVNAFHWVALSVNLCMAGCGTSASSAADWPELAVPIEAVRPLTPMHLSFFYKVNEGVPRGTTILRIHVDELGHTRRVGLVQGSGHPGLDEGAMKSAWNVNYQPYLKDGQPVPVTVVVPMHLR